jgi:hypothetical protein
MYVVGTILYYFVTSFQYWVIIIIPNFLKWFIWLFASSVSYTSKLYPCILLSLPISIIGMVTLAFVKEYECKWVLIMFNYVIIRHLHVSKLYCFVLQLLIIDSVLSLVKDSWYSLLYQCVSVSEVPDSWVISPPLYPEAVGTSTSSIPAEENKPFQQTNISTVSDTRPQIEGENRQQVEVNAMGGTQLGSANSTRCTVHEMRQTQRADTELYI